MNPQQIAQLQMQLGLPQTGVWDVGTSQAYQRSLSSAVKANQKLQGITAQNSPEALVNAYATNSWQGINTATGQPFSPQMQQEAYDKSSLALEPYFKAQKEYETAKTESSLAQKKLDYQNYLANAKTNFETEKTNLDQTAADKGVLFSGARYQKEKDLKKSFEQDQAYKQQSYANNIAGTARDYQYNFGGDAAKGLSSYYKVGGNTYNPNVARDGVGSSKLSKVYNPSQYDFQGRTNLDQMANTQQRAAGLLMNRGNKLLQTGYKNQF